MSDYQVILSSESSLPLTWPDNGKKPTSLPISSLPPIKPKANTGIVLNDHQLSFNSLANVGVVGQTPYPTILIRDGRKSLPGSSIQANNPALNQMLSKKSASKPVNKSNKGKRKPIQSKKIMIKPASSLLSQTALDYTNKDHSSVGENCDPSRLNVSKTDLDKKSTTQNGTERLELSLGSAAEPVALVTSSSLPASSTSNMIITTHDSIHSFRSDISKPINRSLTIDTFPEKTDFVQTLNSSKSSDFDPSGINMMAETVADSRILITSNPCIDSESEVLTSNHSAIIGENVLITSDTSVDDERILHTTVLSEEDGEDHNAGHSLRSDSFHRDHAETILPSDIEHHEGKFIQ